MRARGGGAVTIPPVRSALFVPANRRDWVEKAPRYDADALVLDLEDATPPDQKEEARTVIRETVPSLEARGQAVWVRVNELGSEHVVADLDAACRPGVSVVCLPKVRGPSDVAELDRLIGYYEGRNGLDFGAVGIFPLLETATALQDAAVVFGASTRVRYAGGLAAPSADVAFAVGYTWTDTFEETLFLRSSTLLAARAQGIENPITGLVTALDQDLVRRFAEHSRALGYEGMFVIHPSHVEVANDVFSPSDQEHAWSQEILASYAEAVAQGRGAIVDAGGGMIDTAMIKGAERIVERHRLFARRAAARTERDG
jgi:citrate lyase subunit beta/citryl-CoA lyase